MPRISHEKRKLIVQTWCTMKGISLRQLAKMYKVSVNGAKKIIIKFGEHHTLQDMPGRGRKKGAANLKSEAKIVKLLTNNKSISVRDVAKKVGVSIANVQKTKERHNMKTYKKQKAPKRSQAQFTRAKNRAGKLYKLLCANPDRCILMDDETYVKMDTRTLPGPQFYTAVVGQTVPDEEKCLNIEKFGDKALVWQAICSCGLKTSAFFTKGTIDGENYRKECIKKRLLLLYKKHDVPPIFWPDLAPAHYANATQDLLEGLNIDFVKKNMNPPNCPELRPIERYWAIVKRDLRKKGEVAKNMDQFKKIWNSSARKITETDVRRLMQGTRSKVRRFYRD